MAQANTTRGAKKPPIHLSEADYDVIADLALAMQKRAPDLAQLILDEINRAKIHAEGSLPKDVVALGSEVSFLDDSTGEERRLRLVLPQDADIQADRISVMTPVGAGLIGMSVGREISWPTPDGRPRVLRILEVKQQP
ncbi:MAG: nucleoside diphosphate kinase regulator [Allosphingosinicella sp.]|uniref:nucleoside diphosphate kinase regulator n=1 Tax=Allosphingosinicella sp. TaxID=2823234 RepID=UPI00392C7AAF